jgi:hypothetical protein
MKRLDAATIANRLEAKGIELGKPASEEDLELFEAEMALILDVFFRQIYLKFNGFMSPDGKSMISLWPLARILKEREMSIVVEQERCFAIGDFMIDSDFLMCRLTREAAPIFFQCEQSELAPTASIFFSKLISGDFDFM